MVSRLESLKMEVHPGDESFRLTDYPMHYFAAIQVRNQTNVERVLAEIGVTPVDWRVLAALHVRAGQKIGEIADVTALDRFKVSRCMTRLTDMGLVERDDGDGDRRRIRLRLTQAGREKYEAALAIVKRVYLTNLRGLSEEDFETLMRLLRHIKDNVYRVEGF